MLKLFLSGKKINHETQIKGPIDEESIDFEGVQCCINKVQAKVESFGKDGILRFHTKFDKNYGRYKSNLCFQGLFEAKQGWV
jgi:hypothetical protein